MALLILWPVNFVQANEESGQIGAEFYWEATRAMNSGLFAEAAFGYEKAAQYLSGSLQQEALRMAEFIGRMSRNITANKLFKDFGRSDSSPFGRIEIVGEVKDGDKVWHFYKTEYGLATFLHLAQKGEKNLDELAALAGDGLFEESLTLGDRRGYVSKPLTYIPGAASRIRMWYCSKNDTTNIVYENYSVSAENQSGLESYLNDASAKIFAQIKCSTFPITLWAIIVILFIILSAIAVWRFRLLQKIPKKVWVIIFYVVSSIIVLLLILFYFSIKQPFK